MNKRSITSISVADEDLVEQGERMMVIIYIAFIIIGSCCLRTTVRFRNTSFCVSPFKSFKESKSETEETEISYSIRRYSK